ncbi:hypothetical protein GALMADRAFT_132080 [Galerina marginata CBS 339.88]|uniref:C2H2-type domain-containing protein n=1 Tax=Galerina marginata (strain CBS 339.88) TaxID=685588 RepID=A0A067TST5_GALM3|nr:hypothetical protein GALMADRAFT_132080 [Galerina marginata CBS 339.88]
MASLPSILPSKPTVQDETSTAQEIQAPFGKATTPESTPIFICAFEQCYRLLPSRKALMAHRKKEHHSDDDSLIITWNDPPST